MSIALSLISAVRSNTLGDTAYKFTRAAFKQLRRLKHPSLPMDQQVSTVTCQGRRFTIRHRRTRPDRIVINQCFKDRQYDFPGGAHGYYVQSRYQQILEAGLTPLIIDAGANLGASVLWFNHRYPKAHIVAIEPARTNFELLQHNTANLNVDLRLAGLAGIDGSAYLHDLGEDWAFRTTTESTGPKVQMISLARILEEKPSERYAPLLLKLDIEGAERDIFTPDPASYNRFPLIILEAHDWLFPGQRNSADFLNFHLAAGRELCSRGENLASVYNSDELQNYSGPLMQ
jgi:FkbM family methyltransferase